MDIPETGNRDRRRYPRCAFREPVQYQMKDSMRYGGCLAGDLSEGGIRINFNDFIPLGSQMVIQVFLDLGKMIECLGRVVWVQKIPFADRYQAGLEFAEDDAWLEVKKEIRRFITHANPK